MENEDGEQRTTMENRGSLSPLRDDGRPSPPTLNFPKSCWGNSMLEVFSVQVINFRGKYPVLLYGEINVVDEWFYKEYIYNRNREDAESITTGDIVLLTGPPRVLHVCESFVINVTLKNEYGNLLLNDEVISWWISWDNRIEDGENKLFSEEIKGLFGAVMVNYVVLSDGVAATLEFTLVKVEDENPANLYGELTARNSNFMDEIAESVLFYKASDEDIIVKPGQLIPLSRSTVAVSLDSSLIVKASLFDTFYDEITKGILEFPAQPSGTSEKNISGKYGEIKVKVTWVI